MTARTIEVYHVGDLNRDRMLNPALDNRAARLWAEQEAGIAFLTQRRRGDDQIEYVVTRPRP